MRQYVILGCGPAACAAATEIRGNDPHGQIVMVSREFTPFYLRPALADYVAGLLQHDQLVRPMAAIQSDPDIAVRAGCRVYRLFPHESRVLLSDGTSLYFDRLLIATGAVPRLEGYASRLRNKVTTLSCLADAVRILRDGPAAGDWVLVAGEGYAGLEVVRAFTSRGCRVVYLTSHTRFWSPRSSIARSDVLQKLLAEKVEVLFDEAVLDILDLNGERYRVITSSRRTIDARLVCDARALTPATDYLEGSGVVTDRGVVTDLDLRTNFDNIYAAGDAAQVFDSDGNWYRINFGWESAGQQGRIAGHNLVHGGGLSLSEADTNFRSLYGSKLLLRWRQTQKNL